MHQQTDSTKVRKKSNTHEACSSNLSISLIPWSIQLQLKSFPLPVSKVLTECHPQVEFEVLEGCGCKVLIGWIMNFDLTNSESGVGSFVKVESELVKGVLGISNRSLCFWSTSVLLLLFPFSFVKSTSSKFNLKLGDLGISSGDKGSWTIDGNFKIDSNVIVKLEVALELELESEEEVLEVKGLNSINSAAGADGFRKAKYHPLIGRCIVQRAFRCESYETELHIRNWNWQMMRDSL